MTPITGFLITLAFGAIAGILAALADWLSRPPAADRVAVEAFKASRGAR